MPWIQCFGIDIPASKTALLLGKNRNTINRWYGIFRQVIYCHQTVLKDKFSEEVFHQDLDNNQTPNEVYYQYRAVYQTAWA